MPGQMLENNTNYLRIVQGNFVQKADKDTPNAQLREWKASDGREGSTWEVPYVNWAGKIKDIRFKDTDFGEVCFIELEDAIIALNTDSKYFQDFACKIFNADLTKQILFHPYDLESDGKRRTGISMKQGEEKLSNYFYDFDSKKALHGFPEVDESAEKTKNYWKKYYIDVQEFLVKKVKELEIPKEEGNAQSFQEEIIDKEPDPANDLPF